MVKRGITIISRFSIIACISLVGCAGPRPVLYPNNHFEQVGQERADQQVGLSGRLVGRLEVLLLEVLDLGPPSELPLVPRRGSW
jgi:hypothetical protein